jgi:hypothetical protein
MIRLRKEDCGLKEPGRVRRRSGPRPLNPQSAIRNYFESGAGIESAPFDNLSAEAAHGVSTEAREGRRGGTNVARFRARGTGRIAEGFRVGHFSVQARQLTSQALGKDTPADS